MYYVLFEASPFDGKEKLGAQYYKSLLPHLHKIVGFHEDTFRLSPHRKRTANIAIFDDVDAAWRWRNQENHLRMQSKGSDGVYESYRIRLGPEVGEDDRGDKSKTRHYLTLFYRGDVEGTPPDNVTEVLKEGRASELKDEVVDSFVFQGDQTVWITTWGSEDAAIKFEKSAKSLANGNVVRIRVERDYTKTDRKDAPHETPGMA